MISVLILTRNEEQNLPSCLASVAWSDDIHVFDSLSTDRTVEIANTFGAHVTQRRFDNWAAHQNWALSHIPFKHPWVFYLDADERPTENLIVEMNEAVKAPGDAVAFRIQRRDFFQRRWLKHVQASPYYLRLFQPGRMRYERLVNPTSIADGPIGQLDGYLDHFPFSRGITYWVERHNSYSTLEALQISEDSKDKVQLSFRTALFGRDFHERRSHQKQLFYQLPARPLAKFFILYFLKRGFLDGPAGLSYCILQCFYEYLIVLKTRELRSNKAD